MTKFPPVCLLGVQALQATVRRSQSVTFILLIPGDIVGPDDAVVTTQPRVARSVSAS